MDEGLRIACFRALDALRARCGEDLPWAELAKGFTYDGTRVPFKHPQQGIYRWTGQHAAAALSIATSAASPYSADEETDEGFWYAFDRRALDASQNQALAAAAEFAAPVVYFLGTRPTWWRAIYPCFITELDRGGRRVFVVVGESSDQFAAAPRLPLEVERRWTFREARARLHQGQFRATVLRAYRDQCAICRLKEPRLLDGAHIIPDSSPRGIASVTNGLSLCSIHHRAFDKNLVGVSPDYTVVVAPRLLADDDGPMLNLLKAAHQRRIALPRDPERRPDPDLLAERFKLFDVA